MKNWSAPIGTVLRVMRLAPRVMSQVVYSPKPSTHINSKSYPVMVFPFHFSSAFDSFSLVTVSNTPMITPAVITSISVDTIYLLIFLMLLTASKKDRALDVLYLN